MKQNPNFLPPLKISKDFFFLNRNSKRRKKKRKGINTQNERNPDRFKIL
jgi:hypothetical protein